MRRGENLRKRCTGRTPLDDGVEIGIKAVNDQNCQEQQKLRERPGADSHLDALERTCPGQHLHLDFWLQNCEIMDFCYFKSSCMWSFIMAALRN